MSLNTKLAEEIYAVLAVKIYTEPPKTEVSATVSLQMAARFAIEAARQFEQTQLASWREPPSSKK